jgi:hypothetical protein
MSALVSKGCKIGKIRLKSGGSLHMLPTPKPPWRDTIMEAITVWTDGVKADIPDPVGFVAIAWGSDHTYTIHDFFSDKSPVGRSQGPSYVTECMRRRNGSVDCG